MSIFLKRRQRLISVLVGLMICITGFEAWSRWLTSEPFDQPIVLSNAAKVDGYLKIRRSCAHSLDFLFLSNSRTYSEVGILVGAFKPNDSSYKAKAAVKIPIEWSLVDSAGTVVTAGQSDSAEGFGWTSTEFFRTVKSGLRLAHGRYHLSATLRRDLPEMDGISARLRLGCHNSKIFSGWQDKLLFFGQIIEYFFIWPLTLLIILVIIGLETKHLGPRHYHDPD